MRVSFYLQMKGVHFSHEIYFLLSGRQRGGSEYPSCVGRFLSLIQNNQMPLEHIWGWPPEPQQGHNTIKLPLRMGHSLEGMTYISLLSCQGHVSWISALCLTSARKTSSASRELYRHAPWKSSSF